MVVWGAKNIVGDTGLSRRHISTHRILCWRYTRKCNRKCPFCLSGSRPTFVNPNRDVQRVIARFVEIGVKKISYSGGEPLVHPQIYQTVMEADKHGLEQVLTTNGDNLAKADTGFLTYFQYVKLSFYGNREMHDSVMGSGHYELLLSLARKLSFKKINIGANFMMSQRSIDGIPQFLFDALNLGIRQVLLLTYVPTNDATCNKTYEKNFSADFFETLSEKLRRISKEFKGGVKVHNYSVLNFFVLLDEKDQFCLPRPRGEPDFILGHLFDETLTLPDGRNKPVCDVISHLWKTRLSTDAIIAIS